MTITHCLRCSLGLDFHGTAKAFALIRGHAGFPLSVRARLVRIHIARLIPDLNDRASESLDAAFAGCKRLALALIGRPQSLAGRPDRSRAVAASLNGSPLAMTNKKEISNSGEKARWQPTPYPMF